MKASLSKSDKNGKHAPLENPGGAEGHSGSPPPPPVTPSGEWDFVTPDEVHALTHFLTGRRPVTARQMITAGLAARWGLTSETAFRRKLRAIAQFSKGAIMSHQGSRGYCLTAEATEEEVRRAIATLRHSAGEHLERARQIDEAWRRSR